MVQGNHQVRVRTGDLAQVYQTTLEPPDRQKSVNGLDFPDPYAQVAQSPYATDVWAVVRTGRDPGGLQTLPTNEIRWTLVGTRGAHSYCHLDARGEATYVLVACGEKLWLLIRPRNPADISSTQSFKDIDIMNLDPEKWIFELVYLRRGDKLYVLRSFDL